MKISPAQIEAFLKQPNTAVHYFLFYGPDAGLAADRSRILAEKLLGADGAKDPMQTTQYAFGAMKEDPAMLADELNAMSFFGGSKLVKVTDATPSLPDALQSLFKGDAANYAMIIAGDLPPASTLRKTFESSDFAAAIPCYREEARDVGQYVRQFMQKEGYTIDADAAAAISQAFYGDRMLLKSELQKLALYCGDNKHMTLEHVQASVAGLVDLSMSDICNGTASGQVEKVQKQAEQLMQEGIPAIAMIRALANYFMRLYEARGEIKAGKGDAQVVAAMRPPIFFKDRPVFTQHLRRWGDKKITAALSLLQQVEMECKKTGAKDALLLSRLLLKLSKMAG